MMIPISVGRLCIGTAAARMFMAPFNIPEDPIPATARPMINIFEELAILQIDKPIPNRAKKERNVCCRLVSAMEYDTVQKWTDLQFEIVVKLGRERLTRSTISEADSLQFAKTGLE